MYLTAITHRDELFDLTLRWLNNTFAPEDGETITKIFIYESGISSLIIEQFLDLLTKTFTGPLQTKRVRTKRELRDQIISNLGLRGSRFEELAESFRKNPEYFFPRLPIDATVITDSTSCLVAIARIKRLARVAEKVSFRLVETLFHENQKTAESNACQRVKRASLSGPIGSEADMQDDYQQAEDVLIRNLIGKPIKIEPDALAINDIIGFKIIACPKLLNRVQQVFTNASGISIKEIQRHCGNYNAVNILLDVELPAPDILIRYLASMDWNIAGRYGLEPGVIRSGIPEYVRSGADTVRVEIILTTPEELMESEFGRSIHERRILHLRQRQAHFGPLGQNVEYLIEYLLALASSPTVSISEIPVKLYGRYLPEEIAAMKCALYGNSVDEGLLSSFCLHPDCRSNFCLSDNNQRDGSRHKGDVS